jgi:ParB family chromosome partitioning protein
MSDGPFWSDDFDADLPKMVPGAPAEGLLQNLVGRPEEGAIDIICGGRRLRALWLKRDRGEIPADYLVPARVQPFGDAQALEFATIENDQRSDLTVLEQADAYARLQAMGVDAESISSASAARSGSSASGLRCITGSAPRSAARSKKAI